MNGSRRRACARIAWRQAKRAPWRSALAAAMVALPISALVFGSTVISTATTTSEEDATSYAGSSEITVDGTGAALDARALEADLPRGSEVLVVREFDPLTLTAHGEVVTASVTELRMEHRGVEGMYVLEAGRWAVEPREAVVHPEVLRVASAATGDHIAVDGVRLRIVGTAIAPRYVSNPIILAAPGTFRRIGKAYERALVDLPPGVDVNAAAMIVRRAAGTQEVRTRAAFMSSDVSDATAGAIQTALSFAGTALALAATGLIAGAAFAVGARRQLRVLGLVAAVGGEQRDARSVVVLGGSVLGGIGALIGTGIGLGGAFAALPHMTHFTDSLPGPLEINWPAVIGAPMLGILAATIAASMPARTVSRIAPTEALAGRMPKPRAPGKLAWIGLAIFALGFVITPISWRATYDSSGLTLGLGAIGGGLLLAIPLAVTVVGRLGARLPATLRLAARDVARNGRRTGAALAATTLALSAAVLASSAAKGDAEYWRRSASLTDDQMVLQLQGQSEKGAASTQAPFERTLRQAFPDGHVAAMRYVSPSGSLGKSVSVFGPAEIAPDGGPAYATAGPLEIGTRELLLAMHAEAAIDALERDQIIVLGGGAVVDGTVTIQVDGKNPRKMPAIELASVELPGGREGFLPQFLVSRDGARALGLEPAPVQQILIALGNPVTDEDQDEAREALARVGSAAYIMSVNDWLPATIGLRPIALGLTALVSLLIVGAALAMVGAESRRGRAILSAVGAAPSARRRLGAATAFLLTAVAGVIAVPGGCMTFAVYQWSRPDGYPVIVPWDGIAIAVIGVPMLAALAAYVLSRRPSADAMLRPIA